MDYLPTVFLSMHYLSTYFYNWMTNMWVYTSSAVTELLHRCMGIYSDQEDPCYDVAYAPYHHRIHS